MEFCNLRQPLKQITALLSTSEYPTLEMIIPVFTMIMRNIDQSIDQSGKLRSTHTISFATEIHRKLQKYETKIHCDEVMIVALDSGVKQLLESINLDVSKAKELVLAAYELHYFVINGKDV